MTNSDIIYNAIKAAFTPDQAEALNQKTSSPAKIQLYAADPYQLTAQDFHTFQEWKRLGYSVKKGEHAALVAFLWKYSDRPSKAKREAAEAAGEEVETGGDHFYKCKSHLFHRLQVEAIK